MSLPLSRAQAREIDRLTIESFGLPGIVLMENAGRNAATAIRQFAIPETDQRFVILAGRGNNGGDGLVIARHLDNAGLSVRVLLAAEPGRFAGDAAVNLAVLERSGIPLACLATGGAAAWGEALADATVLVDALLGTGASGPARGPVAAAIAAIARRSTHEPRPRVVAIDLPSGLDCDTGRPLGPCVRADLTLSFVAAKVGFAAAGAADYLGEVHVLDIGEPRKVLAQAAKLHRR